MSEEFCLSEKVCFSLNVKILLVKDVKEFIRLDFENLLLVRDGKISWLEYFKRRSKLLGRELEDEK